jgi:hypothetical protein
MLLLDGFSTLALYLESLSTECSSCQFFPSWLLSAPRKRLSIPKEKRKTIVKKYVVGVVVVQVVTHRVTRVLEEKVDDMPDMASIDGIDPTGMVEDAATTAEDSGDMFMFIFVSKSCWE